MRAPLLISLLAGVSATMITTMPAHADTASPVCPGAVCAVQPARVDRTSLVAESAQRELPMPPACEGLLQAEKAGCVVTRGMAADARRAAIYAAMAQDWTPPRRAAFARLLHAHEAFAWAVGENETDHRSPDAAADAITAEQVEKGAFTVTLKALVDGQERSVANVAFVDADGALNTVYAQVMAVEDASDVAWGSVDKAGIKRTERAWLAYRDAFVAFASTLGIGGLDALKSDLTRRRTVALEGFLED